MFLLRVAKFVVLVSNGDDENFKKWAHWRWQSVSTGNVVYFSESLPPIEAALLFGVCLDYVLAGRRALLCVFLRVITNIK